MKLEEALKLARERSLGLCMDCGGHPDVIDGETIPGYVITAFLDHRDAPDLTIQTCSDFIAEQEDWDED